MSEEVFDAIVMDRFKVIKKDLVQRVGNYCYDGRRCAELGWRFRQAYCGNSNLEVTAAEVTAGVHDTHIAWTWHDAASATHWYRYEKDWGQNETGRGREFG